MPLTEVVLEPDSWITLRHPPAPLSIQAKSRDKFQSLLWI